MEAILQRCLDDVLSTALTLLLTVLLPYAVALARAWLKARTAQITDQQLREGIEWAIDRVDKTAATVVAELAREFTGRPAAQIRQAAINRVLDRLPPAALITLQDNYGLQRLEAIVRGKVESKGQV
jgi:hypothetical protein